jgi:CheY-like chemotaxis protein/methyl-accepting chemotaxis protein
MNNNNGMGHKSYRVSDDSMFGDSTYVHEQLDRLQFALDAFCAGDTSVRLSKDRDDKFADLADAYNNMVEMVGSLSSEVARVSKTAGTEGNLAVRMQYNKPVNGIWTDLIENMNTLIQTISTPINELNRALREMSKGIVSVHFHSQNVSGVWKELIDNVNIMTKSLSSQIQEMVSISRAIALGDLSQKVALSTDGDMEVLKDTINNLVDFMKAFSAQVTKMAREIGTEGLLGAQVVIPNAAGVWKELTSDVNLMANSLTQQVQDVTQVAFSISKGELNKRMEVDAKGEMGNMKTTINRMADYLTLISNEITNLLNNLSNEGKLGTQVVVPEAAGIWKILLNNLNLLADTSTRQVREINKVSSALAEGNFTSKIEGEYSGEVFGLKSNINSMVDSFADLVAVANEIAAGNMDVEMPIRSNNDMLGKALYTMTNNLKRISKENEDESWIKSGQSGLSDCMRGEQNIVELAKNIITYLTKYVHGNVGAFYLLEDGKDEPVLKLTGSYAYTRRKNISKEFSIGEGLVGQAALEKETIVVNDVILDEDFPITAGTFVKQSRTIVVQPFILNKKLVGVFEIGSTERFTDHDLNLLKLVADNIAISINSARDRQKMKLLLDESQRQSDELLEQQQKMKEQSDALKRTNEELEVRTLDLEKQKEEVVVARADIERKAKDLELANKYKSEFLANMSHELRTPLNSLLILAKELSKNEKKNLNEDQVKDVNIIYEGGVDLLNLINDILDLSKIEAGRMAANLAEIQIRDIAINLSKQFEHVARQKNIGFKIELEEGLEHFISDQQRLEQILKNLLSNAIKFTNQGEVKLSITRSVTVLNIHNKNYPSGEALLFTVSDTGIGIEKNKQAMIFEAFQQANGGLSRQYGGTGLGLTISRQLATLLEGEIGLKSQIGEGSEFTLYLPLSPKIEQNEVQTAAAAISKISHERSVTAEISHTGVSTSNNIVQSEHSPVAKQTLKRVNMGQHTLIDDDRQHIVSGDHSILIIEDDHNFADILKKEIRNHGIKVIVADRGEEGLELASRYLPDGIILDLRLPDVNGLIVLDNLKFKLETRHIPIHVFSVDDQEPEILERGAIGFISKPVTQKDIESAIKKIENIYNAGVKDILIIEDNKTSQQSIVRLLENKEIRITTSDTGRRALELLSTQHFDCVILDLTLPDMTGFDVLKELQEVGRKNIPIIVYTGKELSKEEIAELNKYTHSIIIKGVISPERLLDEVSLFLHSLSTNMSEEQQRIVAKLHDPEELLKGRKIMIVDDDMRNIYVLSKKLSDVGMDVYTAENGSVALQLLKEHEDIEIVIMDIMMPVMDGLEAIRRIRKQNQLEKLPIISLTAKAMAEDKEQCMAAGANDYLTKPVDMDQLISLIRIWLYKNN